MPAQQKYFASTGFRFGKKKSLSFSKNLQNHNRGYLILHTGQQCPSGKDLSAVSITKSPPKSQSMVQLDESMKHFVKIDTDRGYLV
jgi:Tfp pilus assembly protein PilE